ncbi:uncharacterized protein [Leptinotarsa decemlineata]|uniref:uncharacterized protein n=1 Tax=Leptinotarsa decemlineata TaxID=7539 RepID=UPI003D306D53
MYPENVHSSFLLGTNFVYTLFKAAIHFAETGLHVWFISSEAFDKVPENIIPPDKHTLRLITFVYLKDYKSLISHLNTIHMWHKTPNVIIISGFDAYTNLFEEDYNAQKAAFLSTSLLDCGSVCAKKKQSPSYLLLTAEDSLGIYKERLQVLHDMYFPEIIQGVKDADLLKAIIDSYSKQVKR